LNEAGSKAVSPSISLIILVVLGVLGGMLVNYLSDILPWRRRLVRPFCRSCETPLSWQNYLLWWRKCPACGTAHTWRSGLANLAYVVFAVLLWRNPPTVLGAWLGLVVLVYFGVVVVIDIEHRLILHSVSLFGAVLGLLTGAWMRGNYYALHGSSAGVQILGLNTEAWLKGLGTSLLGGVVGFGIMWGLYTLGDKLVRDMARRRGEPSEDVALGFGDVNLSGVLGLMLGWPLIILGLFIAIFIGGIISLIYLVLMLVIRRYQLFMALPYGPYLVAGGVCLLYFSNLVTKLLK
jgi:prepilin signal peptidase PulO-like enzyme (type II secretory pathway)